MGLSEYVKKVKAFGKANLSVTSLSVALVAVLSGYYMYSNGITLKSLLPKLDIVFISNVSSAYIYLSLMFLSIASVTIAFYPLLDLPLLMSTIMLFSMPIPLYVSGFSMLALDMLQAWAITGLIWTSLVMVSVVAHPFIESRHQQRTEIKFKKSVKVTSNRNKRVATDEEEEVVHVPIAAGDKEE